MNELALFAGAGGGILGGILSGFRTVAAVEIEPYCREVLLRRQRDGLLPLFPIWDDIRTFDGRPWRGLVDVVTAGFPCQPWSVAGGRNGESDERNLWPETIRIIREVGPPFALLENVPGLLSHDYFGEILGGLAELRYDARWGVLSAAGAGAPHWRRRLWIVAADARRELRDARESESREDQQGTTIYAERCGSVLADANRQGLEKRQGEPENYGEECATAFGNGWWDAEPPVGRVAHGLAHRLERLKALGNGQVPAVAYRAWEELRS